MLIDPAALLLTSLLVGLMTVVVLLLSHDATADLRTGVRLWAAGDFCGSLARLTLLLQPGVMHSVGVTALTPFGGELINQGLVIASAFLHSASLRSVLSQRPTGRALRLAALALPLAYVALAAALPTHALRMQVMLTCTLGCIVWSIRIVWPHRKALRGAALIGVTMLGFAVLTLVAMAVHQYAVEPQVSARALLPPLPALFIDLSAALLLTMGFMLTLFELLQRKIERLSTTDPLTGMLNRRGFMRQFELHWQRARRLHTPLALALLDLDHFKRINDSLGHTKGDDVLVGFALRVPSCTRVTDVLARWGGEEFVLLMPDTPVSEALHVIERLRAAVAASPLAEGTRIVTVSAGVTGLDTLPAQFEHDALIARADASLYRAKLSRNCVVGPEAAVASS